MANVRLFIADGVVIGVGSANELRAGDAVEVDEGTARTWIRRGWAIPEPNGPALWIRHGRAPMPPHKEGSR